MKILIAALVSVGLSCSPDSGPEVVARHYMEDLSGEVSLKGRVFWEPLDTVSLRKLILETPLVKDKTVLEIGTGSGLLSL